MSATVSTIKLHLNQRSVTFLVPPVIVLTVAATSVLISLVFWRSGSLPGTVGWIQGSQSNPGLGYALVSFLIYLGVTSVATDFPFALTLGTTRRAFVVGTLLWDVIISAYVAVILAALLAVELATQHWFAGFYIFDIYLLGAGNIGRLLTIVFLGVLLSLTVGGVFAAAWVRFGARGPQLIAVGLAVVLGVALLAVVPAAAAIAAAFQLWWLAVAAVGATAMASLGAWLLLRSAIVR